MPRRSRRPMKRRRTYGQDAPDGPYYGDNGELSEHDPYAQEGYAEEEPPPRRRRGGMITVGPCLGSRWSAPREPMPIARSLAAPAPSTPPLIKADTTPNKVAPAAPSSEGSKQIYDRIGDRGQGEKVVPREEQPLDIKRPRRRRGRRSRVVRPCVGSAPPLRADSERVAGTDRQRGRLRAGATPTAPPAPTASTTQRARVANPARCRTGQRSAPTGGARSPRRPRPAGARPAPQRRTIPPLHPAPATRAQPPRPSRTADAAQATSGVSRPARSAAWPRATRIDRRRYVVQVSAHDPGGRLASFRAMQAKYPNVLGGKQWSAQEGGAGKGTFYGAQVGPFAARDDARRLRSS